LWPRPDFLRVPPYRTARSYFYGRKRSKELRKMKKTTGDIVIALTGILPLGSAAKLAHIPR